MSLSAREKLQVAIAAIGSLRDCTSGKNTGLFVTAEQSQELTFQLSTLLRISILDTWEPALCVNFAVQFARLFWLY